MTTRNGSLAVLHKENRKKDISCWLRKFIRNAIFGKPFSLHFGLFPEEDFTSPIYPPRHCHDYCMAAKLKTF